MTALGYRYFDPPFIAMAHRGGALLPANRGIENTVRAFGNAVSLGYRYLETDVHATADGELVAIHDDRLDRVSDQRGLVADRTLAELRQVRVGGREPIPTMAELLERFPDARFNIDIKTPTALLPLVRLLKDAGAEDRVCVASFSDTTLRRFRDVTGGRIATAAGRSAVVYTVGTPVLPAIMNTPGAAFQVPVHHRVAGRRITIVTPRFLAAAHRRGMKVHVWDVDDAGEMRRLLNMGVDGIITDAIDVLKNVLVRTGRWQA